MGIFKKKQPAETVDVVALRNEVIELKDRLAAAEQAKVSLDDRLSSLAATTMVLSSATKNDTAELVDQIENLQARLATTTAVGTKVDELHQRVIDVEQRGVGAGMGGGGTDPRIGEQLTSLAARLEQVAELAAAPVAPDDELAARLDLLMSASDSVSTIDDRIARLDARLDEQTALADELASLRQRLDDVGATAAMAVTAAGPAPSAELDERFSTVTGQVDGRLEMLSGQIEERIAAISARIAITEAEARAARDQAADIDGLRGQIAEQAFWAARMGSVDDRISQVQRRIDELDTQGAPQAALDELRQRLDEVMASIPTAPDTTDADRRIGELAERVALTAEAARVARDNAAAIDERLAADTSVADNALALAEVRVAMTARLDELAARLAATEEENATLRAAAAELQPRIDELAGLSGRVDGLAGRVEQLSSLEARVAELAALELRIDELGRRGVDVDRLQQRLDEVAATVPDTTGLQAELARFAVRVESSEIDAQAARDQAAHLDDRLQSVSTQLTNQLAELGREIDSLATTETTSAVEVDDAVIQSLRSGQVRLATEQARYEISFREDLALLAEQVRQLRGRS